MSSTRDHAQPGYEENEDSKGNVAAGRLVHDTQAYLTAEQKRRRRKDAVVAATTVVAYLLLSVGYYCPTQDWSVVDGVYFAFVTITTVGYGDLNGGSDSRTMLFTIFFVLLGVSMIGVAIAEIVEEFRVLQAVAKRKMIERVAADLLAGKARNANTARPSLLNQLRGWLVASPIKRLIGMSIRVVCVGLVSMVLLVATEEPDSDIMQSSHPFITSFYVGIITGLTIGSCLSPRTRLRLCLTFWLSLAGQMGVSQRLRTRQTGEMSPPATTLPGHVTMSPQHQSTAVAGWSGFRTFNPVDPTLKDCHVENVIRKEHGFRRIAQMGLADPLEQVLRTSSPLERAKLREMYAKPGTASSAGSSRTSQAFAKESPGTPMRSPSASPLPSTGRTSFPSPFTGRTQQGR